MNMKRGGIIQLTEEALLYILGLENTSRSQVWVNPKDDTILVKYNDADDKYNIGLNTEIPQGAEYPKIVLDMNYFKLLWLDRIAKDFGLHVGRNK